MKFEDGILSNRIIFSERIVTAGQAAYWINGTNRRFLVSITYDWSTDIVWLDFSGTESIKVDFEYVFNCIQDPKVKLEMIFNLNELRKLTWR